MNDYTIEEKIFDSLNYNIMKKTERKGESIDTPRASF